MREGILDRGWQQVTRKGSLNEENLAGGLAESMVFEEQRPTAPYSYVREFHIDRKCER